MIRRFHHVSFDLCELFVYPDDLRLQRWSLPAEHPALLLGGVRDAAEVFGNRKVRDATPISAPIVCVDAGRSGVADVIERLVFRQIAVLIGRHKFVYGLESRG